MNALPIKMTKQILNIFIILLSSVFIWPCLGATQVEKLKRVTQELVAPPFLPKHDQVAIGGPKVVLVRLVVDQKEIQVAPDAWVQAMTFNGSVPGPMIVVHQNDYVELTLVNPSKNTFMHNIDFHASTGAMGGGELTKVAPGQEVVFRFKATKAGVFVYHCAPGGMMIPYHVVSGMNGAIMVLPRDGLKDEKGELVKYDKAYYIGEQDFYIPSTPEGKYKRYDSTAIAMGDTMQMLKKLLPSHIVFNGAVGALTGENAMTATVREKVLFLHSQANRDSRPHLIGGHADLVWKGGSFSDKPATNYETWFIAGGAAVAALYEFRQPGLYAYVNHNLIEAIMFGAAAHVIVKGEWDHDLMTQVKPPFSIVE
ncbi:MAG TPA: copper-containing nitrite reductase [Woeseiaceae bacterium]|jgi:nitrite reductase (NO-forming)|nr:copper-containing nitrite reductase [Woeseiaceae bacterium]